MSQWRPNVAKSKYFKKYIYKKKICIYQDSERMDKKVGYGPIGNNNKSKISTCPLLGKQLNKT